MGFTTGDGVDLHVEVAGSGDRVVLTHGSWGDATSWAGVVGLLAQHHEVVTWDRRGHSRSGDGPGPGTFQRDADDLAELVDHVGGPAHLVGTSSGASIVLKALAAHPAIARGACVHEPDLLGLLDDDRFGPQLERERAENRRVVELVEAGEYEAAARHFIDEVAVGPGAWDGLPDAARRAFTANAATVVDEFADVFDPEPVDLAALAAHGPRLMVTRGTTSPPLLRAVADLLERRLPSARHATIEGAGHVPYRTHAEAWCRLVTEFLATIN